MTLELLTEALPELEELERGGGDDEEHSLDELLSWVLSSEPSNEGPELWAADIELKLVDGTGEGPL